MGRLFKYFFGVLLLVIIACKKETVNNIKPLVSVVSPSSSQYYTVFDTIYIHGFVTDDEKVDKVIISLKDVNNIQTVSTITKYPQTKEYTINEFIYLDNIHLKSGDYHLTIVASDGENTTQEFITIHINEFPKIRKGVFLFSNNGTNTTITKLDNSFNVSTFQIVNGDFLGGWVNSYDQELISCGSLTGDLVSYNLNTNSLSWNINNNATGFAFFTGMSNTANEVFVSYYNRDIQSYLSAGTPKFTAQAFINSYSSETYVHNDELLISEQPEISSANVRLVAYYMASGIEKQQMLLNEDVQSMFSFSENEIVLFNNVSGTGAIRVYDILQNSVWQPFTLYSGLIDDCTEISNGVYIVAQNGDLSVVNRNNFSKLPYLTGIGATKVKYDVITNQLFVVSGNVLTVYDYSSKIVVTTHNHTDVINELDFWYNK